MTGIALDLPGPLRDWLVIACLLVGGVFGLVGSIGLVRLPTPMMRLHAPTKVTTLGVGGVLAAAMLHAGGRWEPVPHAGLVALFLLLTAPVVAMVLARLWVQDAGPALPPAPDGGAWSAEAPPVSPAEPPPD